jgi:polyhydroxybutyrate depolymerase
MNGTSDGYNLYDGDRSALSAQASAEYFAKLNGQTNPKTTRLPHQDVSDPTSVDRTIWNDAGKPEVVFYTINGGGHVIPQPKVDMSGFGKQTKDLDAPAEIWDFFARQRSLK